MQGWAKVKKAAKYSGVSERTFRDWLKAGLPHTRLPTGTILVRFDDIDNYLSKFQTSSDVIETAVNELLKEL